MNTLLGMQKPSKGLTGLLISSFLLVLLAGCGDATNTAPAAPSTTAAAITGASANTTASTTSTASGTGTTVAGSGSTPQGWQELSSTEGTFKVLMPANPEQKTESVSTGAGNINVVYYQAGSKVAYFVSYADYPADTIKNSNQDTLLDGALNGQIQGANGTSNGDEKAISLGQVPGRQGSFKVNRNGVNATGLSRVYLSNNRLYQAVVVFADSDKPADSETDAFFNSFQITS